MVYLLQRGDIVKENKLSCRSGCVYIADKMWFENTALRNPLSVLDHNLKAVYPHFYSADYDIKILATKPATVQEKSVPFYNDYKEKYGFTSIAKLDSIFSKNAAKNVFLNSFNQVQFEHIAPFIKDTTEILYLFKCPKIRDLSLLSTFKMLRCVHIYWNNSLECLWDMQNNSNLQVLSFVYVTKLKHIENLIDSPVEYIHFDSSDNLGRKKKLLVDESVFSKMGKLKYSFLQ